MQSVQKKENSEFKPAKIRFKNDFVSYLRKVEMNKYIHNSICILPYTSRRNAIYVYVK